MNFLPSSTVTFPLNKNLPWPRDSATPRLKKKNNVFHDGKSPLMHCAKKTRNHATTDTSLGSLPERCPLDVGVVVIIVQHQNTFLK